MTEEVNKFDALAYAVGVLGQSRKIGENRALESSHGIISDAHWWILPKGGGWLVVHEWSDGNQVANAGAADLAYTSGFRDNDDGSLCSEYEMRARALIDAYAEAIGLSSTCNTGTALDRGRRTIFRNK